MKVRMNNSWITAAALSLAFTVGCSDRGDRNAENAPNDPNAPAANAPAENRPPEGQAEPSSRDRPTAGASATSGSSSRSETARRPGTRPNTSSRDTAAPNAAAPGTSPRSGAAAESAPRAQFRELTVPAGTALPLELETPLSSETAQVETPVRARLKQSITVDGVTALPAGTVLSGEVTDVARAGKVKGRSRLAFTFNRLQAENVTENVRTNPLMFEGEASKGEDATKIGAGAGVGAIVGGIVGGGSGAAKGAAIGGAAGTGVVLATRGKDVKLASGMDLAASLAEPLTIRVPAR
jgi:hypothetical protein